VRYDVRPPAVTTVMGRTECWKQNWLSPFAGSASNSRAPGAGVGNGVGVGVRTGVGAGLGLAVAVGTTVGVGATGEALGVDETVAHDSVTSLRAMGVRVSVVGQVNVSSVPGAIGVEAP